VGSERLRQKSEERRKVLTFLIQQENTFGRPLATYNRRFELQT